MTWQLPILLVVVPLLAAPVCVLLPSRGRWCWSLATGAGAACLGISALLWLEVRTNLEHRVSYAIGGWAPPWGIEYRIDELNALVLLLVSGVATLILAGGRASVEREIADQQIPRFYACMLLCITGLLGMAATGDAFNIFVFLEISSLSSYAMIAMGRDRRALAASFQYLLMGTIGATFILIGIGFLYMVTGTLNLEDLGSRIRSLPDSTTAQAAFAFLAVGLALKIALFPLHLWLPNAYAYAPSVVSALLSATATKVSLYVLMRFVLGVYGVEYSMQALRLDVLLLPLSLAAIFAASIVAIFQNDVKRLLAYSSVAQIGYMTLAFSTATETGVTAALVHLFNHGLMKATLFMALAGVALRLGATRIDTMRGLGRAMPWTLAAFVVGGLSIIGVPLTIGFVSKWYLVLATLERGWWPVTIAIVITSLLSAVYIWRVLESAYFHARPDDAAPVAEAPPALLVPTWMLVLASIYFGVRTEVSVGMASSAAASLVGAGP